MISIHRVLDNDIEYDHNTTLNDYIASKIRATYALLLTKEQLQIRLQLPVRLPIYNLTEAKNNRYRFSSIAGKAIQSELTKMYLIPVCICY